MKHLASLMAALALLIMTVGAVGAQFEPAEPQDGCEYFDATGHNLCDPFQAYWNTNGGLEVFGYPISEAFEETNPDLGVDLLTQYFERERLEYHPENEGTEYEILLGRLGAEVLDLMGVNWFAFPKDDPGEANYFEETGFAVPPEFAAYWSSHGLDLGDEGISYRESLALFGYPISPLQTETNMAGDTVPTQWFERARFELHEGGVVLLGLLGSELIELRQGPEPPPFPEPPGEVVASGLNNPRHLNVAADGSIYVAEAGASGEGCVSPDPENPEDTICLGDTGRISVIPPGGEGQPLVATLPSIGGPDGFAVTGPHDVIMGDDGILRVLLGLGAPAQLRDQLFPDTGSMLGTLQSWNPDDAFTTIADIAAWEDENNPDDLSDFPVGADSNPYGLAMLDDGSYLVTDAGGNTLLHVQTDGTIEMIALFETRMVPLPPQFVEEGGPTEIPMQPVPTSVTVGPDGAYYVGELTGFPFPVDGARVYRVTPEGDVTVHAEGFTNIVDIAFDNAGNLYVVEMASSGLLAAEAPDAPPSAFTGAVIKVAPDGTRSEIASEGLIAPGGVDVADNGTIYVSNYSVFPQMGQVVAIEGEAPPPPPDGPGTVLASGLASPRGITIDGDVVYVAEAGAGGDGPCIPGPEGPEVCAGETGAVIAVNGSPMQVISGLPSIAGEGGFEAGGPHDVIPTGDGGMYVLTGLGANPEARADLGETGSLYGSILLVNADGSVTRAIDVAGYEVSANPDGGLIDSNPFRFVSDGEGGFVVTDAGANALLHFAAGGEVTTLAVFRDRLVDTSNLPIPDLPPEIPMQAVPTGLAVGPDGAYYVGELTGFPFVPGSARVWRVTPGGEPEVHAEGFTNIVDVAFDSEGNLYVLEIAAGSLLGVNPEDPSTMQGRLVMVAPDGTQTVVADEGLILPTGLAVGEDGSIFISNNGVVAGLGELILLDAES